MRIVPRGHKLPPEEHQRRLALHHQGLTNKEIAERLGLSEGCIGNWRNRAGLARPSRQKKREVKPLADGWKAREADMPKPAELAEFKRQLRGLVSADW